MAETPRLAACYVLFLFSRSQYGSTGEPQDFLERRILERKTSGTIVRDGRCSGACTDFHHPLGPSPHQRAGAFLRAGSPASRPDPGLSGLIVGGGGKAPRGGGPAGGTSA